MITYQPYTLRNFREIPQLKERLSAEELFDIEVVGNVLPFKANNYVVDVPVDRLGQLPGGPHFVLTFPQRAMLRPEHYAEMSR